MGRMIRRILLALALALALCGAALADYQIRIGSTDLSAYTDLPTDILNILLIGTDSWEDVRDAGRSDTMIVASYDTKTGDIRLLALARDLLCEIPGGGGLNRLNAAHSFGGPNLLMKTINKTFHLNITRYVSLNIYGLWRVIDSMGGLTMDITQEEARRIRSMIAIEFPREENLPCPSGTVRLNGLQAMTFARIRELDNDFGRMGRQQRVLRAIGAQLMEMEEEKRQAFVSACLANVSTNLSAADVLTMSAAALAHGVGEVRMATLPNPGTYVYDDLDGMSVLLSEETLLAQEARAYLYGP